MTQFLDFFVDMLTGYIDLLGQFSVEFYGYRVNLLAVLFVFLIIGFVVSVFWKGARS